jgi:hypothetical protein
VKENLYVERLSNPSLHLDTRKFLDILWTPTDYAVHDGPTMELDQLDYLASRIECISWRKMRARIHVHFKKRNSHGVFALSIRPA